MSQYKKVQKALHGVPSDVDVEGQKFEAGFAFHFLPVTFPFQNSVWVSFHLSNGGVNMFKLEWARSLEEMHQGYLYRPAIEPSNGMLFLHQTEELMHFHTCGLHFNLDFIYLNAQGKIVHLEPNVAPDSSVDSAIPSIAVIEMPGGWCKRMGLKKNDFAYLILPEDAND